MYSYSLIDYSVLIKKKNKKDYSVCFCFIQLVEQFHVMPSFDRYGDLYTEQNVAISGIHTHAGPGGYLQYVVYIVTSLGFVRQSFDALVDGIEKCIVQAHENLQPGSIYINKGKCLKIIPFAES